MDLSVGAERTTVLKAVSEGETRFRSLAMASDTDHAFPSPDGPGRQFLAEFGEFPVYLVNRDMQVKGHGLDKNSCVGGPLSFWQYLPKRNLQMKEMTPRASG